MSSARGAQLRRRYRRDRLLRALGVGAIAIAIGGLLIVLSSIFVQAALVTTEYTLSLEVALSEEALGIAPDASPQELRRAPYATPIKRALREQFPDVAGRSDRRKLGQLLSAGAEFDLQDLVTHDASLVGRRVPFEAPLSAPAQLELAGHDGGLSDRQLDWLASLDERGIVSRRFNWRFFTAGDSREPELAGIGGAMLGSALTLLVTLAICFPVGVAAAVYLEEYATRNRWTDFIEVNINNLAAVPSIVFGLLGLAMFLGVLGMPRSAPLVGGLVLALMTLPTVVIATRAALSAVPPSIREGALGVGATRLQMVVDHVLPLALPGVMTGTIIGMARALGETAPLLMVGMVAFVVDVPTGVTDSATVLPVQIFLWADSPDRGFAERASAAIAVLLAFLIAMNSLAVWLRSRYEQQY